TNPGFRPPHRRTLGSGARPPPSRSRQEEERPPAGSARLFRSEQVVVLAGYRDATIVNKTFESLHQVSDKAVPHRIGKCSELSGAGGGLGPAGKKFCQIGITGGTMLEA